MYIGCMTMIAVSLEISEKRQSLRVKILPDLSKLGFFL